MTTRLAPKKPPAKQARPTRQVEHSSPPVLYGVPQIQPAGGGHGSGKPAEEALLLDNEGYVAEGSGENIFLVRDGVLHTPELTSCLDGITRNTIFALAADQGLEILERRITRDEVYISDEAFFTGTAAEVLPIRELDGRQIGTGVRGPITTALQDAYFEQVRGQRLGHDDWLTLVKD